MSDTYTKLFGSITASTIWQEPAHTRLVWITMLAMADQHGVVHASVPGLAHIANVPLADTEAALRTLLGPDPYSRTKEHEGRRIEEVDGGWVLLNHAKFRAVRSSEERREYFREHKRKAREAERAASTMSTSVHHGQPGSTGNHLSDQIQIKSKEQEQEHVRTDVRTPDLALDGGEAKAPDRFPEFWAEYPRKEAKADALKAWGQKRGDAQADRIIADVKRRKREHGPWQDRQFVPLPASYLRGERWEDEIRPISAPQPRGAAGRDSVDDLIEGAL